MDEQLTADDVIAIGRQKGIDMSKYEGRIRQKMVGQPTQPQAQTQIQPVQKQSRGIIPDLLDKINPSGALSTTVGRGAQGFMAGLGITPPAPQEDDYTKLYNQEAIKQQFEDPIDRQLKEKRIQAIDAGLTVDEAGNVVKTSDIDRDSRENRIQDFEIRRQGGKLRDELNQNQYIKRYREMNSAASGIDSILQDTLSRPDLKSKNVGDQALITLYNKILDPISVVRESEYARTPEGQALMNRIQGFVQKVQAGGSGLTDQDRIEIARAAKVLINNSGELYNKQLGQYEELAGVYGVDPSMVMTGFDKFTPYDIDKKYGQPDQTGGQPVLGSIPQEAQANTPVAPKTTRSGNKFRKVG